MSVMMDGLRFRAFRNCSRRRAVEKEGVKEGVEKEGPWEMSVECIDGSMLSESWSPMPRLPTEYHRYGEGMAK
jgi:hypothetical protein